MKKFFRITLGNELFFDLPNDNDISLAQFISNVRMLGYVMNESFYVPVEKINYIVTAQIEHGQVTQFKPTLVQ